MSRAPLIGSERGPARNALTQSGGVIDNVTDTLAYPWQRHNFPLDTAARLLSQDIRAEIESANWKVGQRIPGSTWLAAKGKTSVEVAGLALRSLEQQEWLASDLAGGYVICVPTPLAIPEPTVWPTPPVAVEEANASTAKELVTRITRKAAPRKIESPKPAVVRVRSYVTYVIGVEGLPFVKIGHTTKPPVERLKSLQTGTPMALNLLCIVRGDWESDLHAHFDDYRICGEWFDLSSLGDPVAVVQAAVGEIEASRA